MKLFQVHTGFYDPNISDGFYEGHTNIFVCAKDENDARKIVKEKKEYKNKYVKKLILFLCKIAGFTINFCMIDLALLGPRRYRARL